MIMCNLTGTYYHIYLDVQSQINSPSLATVVCMFQENLCSEKKKKMKNRNLRKTLGMNNLLE